MRLIPLTKGFVALVDDADYEKVSAFKWQARLKRHAIYATRRIPKIEGSAKKHEYLHQFLMPGAPFVDHKNGDGRDNRRENLRASTPRRNSQSFQTKRKSSSKFRGIYWYPRLKKWRAQITINGKNISLGVFREEIEAARAYNNSAQIHFKDFACLNKI